MSAMFEANERTLIMFDSVCSGLASCLSLVHSDIRQMTEHRNKLAQLEQEKIQAKCVPPNELIVDGELLMLDNNSSGSSLRNSPTSTNCNCVNGNHNNNNNNFDVECDSKGKQRASKKKFNSEKCNNDCGDVNDDDDGDDQQQHYLAGLKLLDKRLADSFSQAFNLNEQQKSSIISKHQTNSNKPSIFQVLLGKTSASSLDATTIKKGNNKTRQNKQLDNNYEHYDNQQQTIDDINRQTRLAMQFSKQLECHLFKIEDLRSKYEMHLKMGLVVRGVGRNFINNCHSTTTTTTTTNSTSNSSTSSKSNKPSSFRSSIARHYKSLTAINDLRASQKEYQNNSKSNNQDATNGNRTTIREFIDNIDKIEQEFESYMGSFLFAIEDIQGFARVCPGDVFEISIKYGDLQKFKTKITVLKDSRQKCDNRQVVFKARIADILAIKGYECKGLGKRVLLGHKLCETRDLFTARSQLMTISLNQTGSIKLNLIVTWNPLHMAPNSSSAIPGLDIAHISLPPTPISSSTLSSMSSVPSLNGTTTTINIKSQNRARLNKDRTTNIEEDDHRYSMKRQLFNQHHYNMDDSQLINNRHSSHHTYSHRHDGYIQQQNPSNESMYQTVDPTYGYYIPPPDYLTNEVKY